MYLFGRPKRQRAHRKTKTWLDKEAAHAGKLLEQVKNNPVIRAEIIRHAIGVAFDPEELEMMEPQEFFRLRARLLNALERDNALPMTANDNAFFDLFAPKGSRTYRKAHHDNLDEDDPFPDMSPIQGETTNEGEQSYYEPRHVVRRPKNSRKSGLSAGGIHGAGEGTHHHSAAKDPTIESMEMLAKTIKETMAVPQVPSTRIYAVEVDGN